MLDRHIKHYLKDIKLMQLATCREGQPWLCNVWYVMDGDVNIYFTSRITRRHSREIADNSKVACTFHRWFDGGLGQKGQALVVAGTARLLPGDSVDDAYALYAWENPAIERMQDLSDFRQDKGPHFLYQITPHEIIWWDEVNNPDNPRQVLLQKHD